MTRILRHLTVAAASALLLAGSLPAYAEGSKTVHGYSDDTKAKACRDAKQSVPAGASSIGSCNCYRNDADGIWGCLIHYDP